MNSSLHAFSHGVIVGLLILILAQLIRIYPYVQDIALHLNP